MPCTVFSAGSSAIKFLRKMDCSYEILGMEYYVQCSHSLHNMYTSDLTGWLWLLRLGRVAVGGTNTKTNVPALMSPAYNEHNGWEMGMDGMTQTHYKLLLGWYCTSQAVVEHVPQSRTLISGMYDIWNICVWYNMYIYIYTFIHLHLVCTSLRRNAAVESALAV